MYKAILTDDWGKINTRKTGKYQIKKEASQAAQKLMNKYNYFGYRITIVKI